MGCSNSSSLVGIFFLGNRLSNENGLTKPSAADALQARSLDPRRFIRKIGILPGLDLQEIARAIAAIIEDRESNDET